MNIDDASRRGCAVREQAGPCQDQHGAEGDLKGDDAGDFAGIHVVVLWRSQPLTVVTEVHPGDDWRTRLLAATSDALDAAIEVLHPVQVRFEWHDGLSDAECPRCAGRRDLQGEARRVVAGAQRRGGATSKTRLEAGATWQGPHGQIAWTLAADTVAVLADLEAFGGEGDWKNPLVHAVVLLAAQRVSTLVDGDVDFRSS